MKLLFIIALTVAASVYVVSLVRDDPGFIVIGYQNWSIELSLALGVLLVVGSFILLYFLIRLLAHTWRFPAELGAWRQRRKIRHANRLLSEGFIALAEGHWSMAERKLTRSAQDCPSPLIAYLGAASAAQQQGDDESRDFYLQRAEQAHPDGKLAVGLTQAEYQLDRRQLDQALGKLTELRGQSPKNALMLRLLVHLHKANNDWASLEALLPELKRRRVLSDSEWDALDLEVHRERMLKRRLDAAAIQSAWNTASRTLKHNPDFTLDYVKLLHEAGADPVADKAIRETLREHWDDRLVDCFGMIEPGDPAQQLAHAEAWLSQHQTDPALLLTLGRLSRRNRLWGKARSYMEASIGLRPTPEAHQELGELLEQLNEHEAASEQFAAGLKLAVDAIKKRGWESERGHEASETPTVETETEAPKLAPPEQAHSQQKQPEHPSRGLITGSEAALSRP
ncbi:MAG: heme biosynthesis HemY N-terminal domain-containing protein [Gammaproteobacteria bacterium]